MSNRETDASSPDESADSRNVERQPATDPALSSAGENSTVVGDQANAGATFKDRRAGLILFGILQILMGSFCALMVLVMWLSPGNEMSLHMMIPVIGAYSQMAVGLVWLGVGSIMARRWARAVTLVLAWAWLVMGILGSIMMIVWMPRMTNLFAAHGRIPPQAMVIFQGIMLATMGCMYLILPGIFVLFYQSKHVKATCELADPHTRWTDKCPLPVLALSLMLGFGAVSMIFTVSYGVFPFFGILLKGVPAVLMTVGICSLFAYLAWGTYRLKMTAWWTALIAYLAFLVSAIVTFSRISMLEFYREMKFPAEQIEQMEKSGMLELMNMPLLMGGGGILIVGYMLWIRKYFLTNSVCASES